MIYVTAAKLKVDVTVVSYGILSYFLLNITLPLGIEINGFELVLIGCIIAMMLFSKITINSGSRTLVILFFLFVVLITMQTLLMQNEAGYKQILKYLEMLIVLIGINMLVSNEKDLRRLFLATLIVPNALESVESIIITVLGDASKVTINTGLIIVVYLYFAKRSKLFFILLIYSITMISITRYRTDFILLIIFLLTFIALEAQKKLTLCEGRIKRLVLTLAVLGSTVAIMIFPLSGQLKDFLDIGRPTASNIERISLLSYSVESIRDNFWFGIGSGRFTEEYVKSPFALRFSRNITAHNHYLETFVEDGVFGFGLFLAIVVVALLIQFKNVKIASQNGSKMLSSYKAILAIYFAQIYYLFLVPFSGERRIVFALILGLIVASSWVVRK